MAFYEHRGFKATKYSLVREMIMDGWKKRMLFQFHPENRETCFSKVDAYIAHNPLQSKCYCHHV